MFNGNYCSSSRETRAGQARLKPASNAGSTFRIGRSQASRSETATPAKPDRPKQISVSKILEREFVPTMKSDRAARSVVDVRFGGDGSTDSILSLYMREVGQVALLTAEQEVTLAARIKRGDAAARELMIRANLRFVIKIAREYENLGMPLLDLINEGNIGLMKAVEKFDPAKGGKLSTYSSLWIKQQIRRALASQGKTIRLPVHIADKIYQLSQAEARLRHVFGRDATDEELAHELGVKVKKISRLRRAAMRPASLDAPLGDENSSTVAEVVADDNAGTPFEHLLGKSESDLIGRLVEHLPEREANIIRFRFGLDGGHERTLEDVGRKFKLTRERIRQLQNVALAKLRRMLEEPSAMPLAA